ncbi:MAG: hypothetical protein ABI690_33260 [Chloroflexota bacterium]
MPEDIFQNEWRECLEAHYMHVIRTRDKVTEPSLTVVMGQAGFNASELAELRVRATMHIDDSGANFVPDLEALAPVEEPRIIAVAVPDVPPSSEPTPEEAILEPQTEFPVEALLEGTLTESQAEVLTEELIVEIEDQAAEDAQLDEEPPPADIPEEDPDAPQQLSLF